MANGFTVSAVLLNGGRSRIMFYVDSLDLSSREITSRSSLESNGNLDLCTETSLIECFEERWCFCTVIKAPYEAPEAGLL